MKYLTRRLSASRPKALAGIATGLARIVLIGRLLPLLPALKLNPTAPLWR